MTQIGQEGGSPNLGGLKLFPSSPMDKLVVGEYIVVAHAERVSSSTKLSRRSSRSESCLYSCQGKESLSKDISLPPFRGASALGLVGGKKIMKMIHSLREEEFTRCMI